VTAITNLSCFCC